MKKKSIKNTSASLDAAANIDSDDVELELDEALAELDDPVADKQEPRLSKEPLFSSLLRRAVKTQWPENAVLDDYCTHIAPKLSTRLGTAAAKGGEFAAKQKGEGKQGVTRYINDQSLRAHLVNGLFPVYRIAARLKAWGASQLRRFDDTAARLFIAGYTLHDYNKLPEVKRELSKHGYGDGTFSTAGNLPLVEQLFSKACKDLGISEFLASMGGHHAVLHELIYIAANTQQKWDTLRNLAKLPNLRQDGPTLELCVNLSRLADLIAYVGRTPRDVIANDSIRKALTGLGEGKAKLCCHHVSEVRGVLTNLIHNAALQHLSHEHCEPLLYAPSGVVYLVRTDVRPISAPSADVVAQQMIQWLDKNCRAALQQHGKGLMRGPIGVKVADFYRDYFDAPDFVRMLARQVPGRIIIDSKKPKAAERYKKISNSGGIAADLARDLPSDIKVDQLAEWAYACELFTRENDADGKPSKLLLRVMGLEDLSVAFDHVPRENRITGGLGLHWYFAAGHYVKRHPGLDPSNWRERMDTLAEDLATQLARVMVPNQTTEKESDAILRGYVRETLSFVGFDASQKPQGRLSQVVFGHEFNTYSNAKRGGRGATRMSSLRSTALASEEQREAVVQFAPQVYSNKLPLHGSKALRGIDPISATEAMLRQIFMPGINAAGKNFEGLKARYLYLYPTYFFSPETLDIVKDVQDGLRNVSVTGLRKLLTSEDEDGALRLDAETLQGLEEVLVLPPSERGAPNSRLLRMQFPEDTPVTFHFFGMLAGRDPTDAESWALPTLLALLLPLCLDVKIVASESLIPVLAESDGMNETVLLDSPHTFVSHLIPQPRINIDHIHTALQRILVAYFIHLDANSKEGGTDFYQWGRIPELARNLAQSPLHVFAYLKKWERKKSGHTIMPGKAALYLLYADCLSQGEQDHMTIPRELTSRYRAFYRANGYASNAILRPLTIASKALMTANQHAFGDADSLIDLVRGELVAFMGRVLARKADGYPVKGQTAAECDAAVHDFAAYFVNEVFIKAFRGDRAALRGKQLNLIKNACEVIYREEQAREWEKRGAHTNDSETDASGQSGNV